MERNTGRRSMGGIKFFSIVTRNDHGHRCRAIGAFGINSGTSIRQVISTKNCESVEFRITVARFQDLGFTLVNIEVDGGALIDKSPVISALVHLGQSKPATHDPTLSQFSEINKVHKTRTPTPYSRRIRDKQSPRSALSTAFPSFFTTRLNLYE